MATLRVGEAVCAFESLYFLCLRNNSIVIIDSYDSSN